VTKVDEDGGTLTADKDSNGATVTNISSYYTSLTNADWIAPVGDYNQNFATTVALHQPDVRPCGLVRGSARPPGLAPGSPVKTKQFSLERFVS